MRQLKISKSITNRENASLDKYLQEIGKEDLITALQEVELAQKIRAWDQKALEKMVKANLRFVVSVAKQYQNQWLSLPDLINEGNLGLIKAAQRFDEKRWFKFISYAVWWIRQSILNAIAEQARMVRLPLNQVWTLNRVRKTQSQLEQVLQRDPTSEEVSDILDIKTDKFTHLMESHQQVISLDTHVWDDTTWETLWNTMASPMPATDYKVAIDESLKTDIERALATLNRREADIVKMFFGLSPYPASWMTLEEIGKEHDLSYERVRQIKDKAIRKLKHPFRTKQIKQYLG